MAARTYDKATVESSYPDIYTTIGWQISELTDVISKLNTVKDKWDEVVESNQSFYSNFATDLDNLITHLNGYKSYMETKGSELKQYAKWAD